MWAQLPPEIRDNIRDANWRLNNLYQIITKGDGDDDDLVVQFRPNAAQRRLLARLHYRNLILKARQLGFTTLIAILWLDTALFSSDPLRLGIIAQDKDKVEEIFRDKIAFAYDNLPPVFHTLFPVRKRTTRELEFAHNGAVVRVGTSMRGGTLHRLHVSELGKIAAKFPEKSREVQTGSIPAVPKTGILVIESTAEGSEGMFYDLVQAAMATQQTGRPLNPRDYRLHFFAWWEAAEYRLDPETVVVSDAMSKYFLDVEGIIKRKLSPEQRAWYCATVATDFSGDQSLMWQEYPSYPDEAFKVSTEGAYYATQLAAARTSGRVMPAIPIEPSAPVHVFWDLGRGDMTAMWLMQRVANQDRMIGYYEASGEDLSHFTRYLQGLGVTLGTMYLPHDAAHRRLGKDQDTNQTLEEMVRDLLPGIRTHIVPRISNLTAGIQQTRDAFASLWFCERKCQQGLKRLAGYRKKWDATRGCWSSEPNHDDNSHGADALRQYAQVKATGEVFGGGSVMRSVAKSGASWRRQRSPMAM